MRLFRWLLKQPVPKQIERYSRFSPSPLSIKQFLDFGEYGAKGSHGPGAAAIQAATPDLRSFGVKSVGTAGGARGYPGGSPEARISGRGGAGPGPLAPSLGLTQRHRNGVSLQDPHRRRDSPNLPSLASHLLDTNLTALKTSERDVGGFLMFLFLDFFFFWFVKNCLEIP